MKCALAHILPDGRIINPRSIQGAHHQQSPHKQRSSDPSQQHQQQYQQQKMAQSQQLFPQQLQYQAEPINAPPSTGPTTSATIRNIFVTAASAHNGIPEYSQTLASTGSQQQQQQQQPQLPAFFDPTPSSVSSEIYASIPSAESSGIPVMAPPSSTLGENGPIIGSVPVMHHHKSASFVAPSNSSADYIHASQPQLVAPQPVSSSFTASALSLQHQSSSSSHFLHPSNAIFASAGTPTAQAFQQHRSLSTTTYASPSFGAGGTPPTSASIWNKNVQPSSSISSPLRPSAMSMLMNSVAAVKISDTSSSPGAGSGASSAFFSSSPALAAVNVPSQQQPSTSHYSSMLHQDMMADNEFAIDDDDDETKNDGLEDFVPSSLTDLLTEQERRRRGSRPSSTTNPLLMSSSPHLLHPLHQSHHARTPSADAGASNTWATSPRLLAQQQARRALDDDYLGGAAALAGSTPPIGGGHSLRASFSLSNGMAVNIDNNNNVNGSSSYPAPIGTPERGSGSYMSSYKSMTQGGAGGALPAIGTPVASVAGSSAAHRLSFVRSPSGLQQQQQQGSAGKIPNGQQQATGNSNSLFDDDINNTHESEYDEETQFAMDDEVVDSKVAAATAAVLTRS